MDILKRPAEEFGNDTLLEELWAKKAFEHAETYFNLLLSVDSRLLQLTPFDSQIYSTFRQDFPNFRVDVLDENELKSDIGKIKWRSFIDKFDKIEDYSFGTLIRIDSKEEFSPENSILVVRIQFLAIEIARNREGYNDSIRGKFAKKYAAMVHNEPQIAKDS
ncbi:hypothetical protein PVAND_014075 [Polypedilum vanderplanki]|uniref:Polysaccharide biosynthesis domain-containing protein n=1 Tax=Polypedilum vanderplanki TaxID=319348 RepID=A0A9J6CRN3_POLVA|nr:hypothetical protein PVAND_014075 [Polypedilum vanderplanki]